MKRVSVLIPTYKSNNTLVRAIDSVLEQTYDDLEIIVVDDNEPDNPYRKSTEALMKRYSQNKKVHYVKHEHNKNGAAARNTAYRHSTGDYITFLDDDDFYYPNKIRAQVEYLEEHPKVGGCYCWRKQFDENICGEFNGDLTYEILSLKFTPTTPCIMIRRNCYESLNGFDESYQRHQDFEFLLRYFKMYTLEFVPDIEVEISTNGVNNAPTGKKLIDLKDRFFEQFDDEIQCIYKADRRKGQEIYLNHYVRVFKDLLRHHYYYLALKTYFKERRKCGARFFPFFFKLVINGRLIAYKRVKTKSIINNKRI